MTIELGTNDLCYQPKTAAATFETHFRSAMAILKDGLPRGSHILVMSVPDLAHIHDIIAADRSTRLYFAEARNAERCAPFAGAGGRVSYSTAVALMDADNQALSKVCGEIEASLGPSDALHCTSDIPGLAERDFTIADISKADHFHFAFSGQNKMAEAAWAHLPWAALPIPAAARR